MRRSPISESEYFLPSNIALLVDTGRLASDVSYQYQFCQKRQPNALSAK
jgi:hypothetical protein